MSVVCGPAGIRRAFGEAYKPRIEGLIVALKENALGNKGKGNYRGVCPAGNTEHPLVTQKLSTYVHGVSMLRHMMMLEVDECQSRMGARITSDRVLSSGQEG